MTTTNAPKKEDTLNASFTQSENPLQCKTDEDIRFYVRDLCLKIEALEERLEYVPSSSCTFLAEYHTLQSPSTIKNFAENYAIE